MSCLKTFSVQEREKQTVREEKYTLSEFTIFQFFQTLPAFCFTQHWAHTHGKVTRFRRTMSSRLEGPPAAEEYPLFITLYPSWELKGTEVSHEPLRHMKSWHELRKLDVWSARISSQFSPIQPVPEEELFALLTSQHPSSHHTSNPPKRSHRAAQAHNSTSLLALSGGPHPEPQTALHGGQRASRGKHPGQTTSETRTQRCRVSSACQGFGLIFTWTWDKAGSRHWSSLDRRGAEKPSAARSAPACCRRPALGVPAATSPLTAALMSCRKHRLNI